MRPMFVFLTAKALSGEVSEKAYRAASLIELLHTATLVHDDVVDDSNMRRGFFSLNALWKNKIAVLVGDFLLSKGLLLSVENKDFDLLEVVSTAVKEMSEGELLQIEKARKLDITEEVYFDIIKKKTAALIAACTAAGAVSSNADQKTIDEFRRFGELIGIAFQIKDDLFDYTEDKIGKPTGIDIQEQKMTLPLIYTLNNVDKTKKKWIIDIVKNNNKNKKKVKELIEFVKENQGIEYTMVRMKEYHEKALKILDSLQPSPAKESLITLVNYVINRNI
jgi:octaprenyl-diphosphate synthase